jgi:hypothetical protein
LWLQYVITEPPRYSIHYAEIFVNASLSGKIDKEVILKLIDLHSNLESIKVKGEFGNLISLKDICYKGPQYSSLGFNFTHTFTAPLKKKPHSLPRLTLETHAQSYIYEDSASLPNIPCLAYSLAGYWNMEKATVINDRSFEKTFSRPFMFTSRQLNISKDAVYFYDPHTSTIKLIMTYFIPEKYSYVWKQAWITVLSGNLFIFHFLF